MKERLVERFHFHEKTKDGVLDAITKKILEGWEPINLSEPTFRRGMVVINRKGHYVTPGSGYNSSGMFRRTK